MMKKIKTSIALLATVFALYAMLAVGVVAMDDIERDMFSLSLVQITVDQNTGTMASSIRVQYEATGSTIELARQNNDGWVFAGWDVIGVDEYAVDSYGVLTFIMPNGNVSVVDTWNRYTPKPSAFYCDDECQRVKMSEPTFSKLWAIFRWHERLHCPLTHIRLGCLPTRLISRLF